MARKSNKTAHVLSLLAGNDAKKETAKQGAEETSAAEAPQTAQASTAELQTEDSAKSPTAPEAPAASSAQSVSIINKTEPDPIAELIHDKLLDELNDELKKDMPDTVSQNSDFSTDFLKTTAEKQASAQEPETAPTTTAASGTPAETPVQKAPETASDCIRVNVMERIVEDKIIYFMREFDLCTCERCKQDAIALTLTGLPAKYIVTSPESVEPLISYYTNKYIADVTVEATRSCLMIKEQPRH